MYDIRGADGTGTSANPVANDSANAISYTVRKLADGNCWMTENLQLPLAIGASVEASYNDGSIFTYAMTSDSSISTNTLTPYSNGVYYYTWFAATAERGTTSSTSSTDIDGSICPKGWKLPYNYTISPNVSWGALTDAYGLTVNGGNGSGYATLEALPISSYRYGAYGYAGASSVAWYGIDGYHWSSTVYSTGSRAYLINFNSSMNGVSPQIDGYGMSRYGFATRCVASPLVH